MCSEDTGLPLEFGKEPCSRSSRVLHVRVSAQLGKVARRRRNHSLRHERIERGMKMGNKFVQSSEETNLRSCSEAIRDARARRVGMFEWKAK